MGGWLKGFILSAGVWLGIINTPVDPSLDINLWRTEDLVIIDAVVEEAESASLDRVLMSGNPLLLTLTVDAGEPVERVHRLVYDPARQLFTYTDENREIQIFGDPFTALLHFFHFRRIPVFATQLLYEAPPIELLIRADIAVEDLEDTDPNWLWGYQPLNRRFLFRGIQEIPF